MIKKRFFRDNKFSIIDRYKERKKFLNPDSFFFLEFFKFGFTFFLKLIFLIKN